MSQKRKRDTENERDENDSNYELIDKTRNQENLKNINDSSLPLFEPRDDDEVKNVCKKSKVDVIQIKLPTVDVASTNTRIIPNTKKRKRYDDTDSDEDEPPVDETKMMVIDQEILRDESVSLLPFKKLKYNAISACPVYSDKITTIASANETIKSQTTKKKNRYNDTDSDEEFFDSLKKCKKQYSKSSNTTETDYLTHLQIELDKHTKFENNHIIWISIPQSNRIRTMRFNKVTRCAHHWFYILKTKKIDLARKTRFIQQCNVTSCIQHWKPISENTGDFEELKRGINKYTILQDTHLLWTGKIHSVSGFGRLTFCTKTLNVHQWYYLYNQQIWTMPKNSRLIHTCDQSRCINHWDIRHTHLNSIVEMSDTDYEQTCIRFDQNTLKDGECVRWKGLKDDFGYGKWSLLWKFTRAHRIAYMLAHLEEIPNGLVVRHKCKNRDCVREEHLELGTHLDNMRDRTRDGTNLSGIDNPACKLTEDDVKSILAEIDLGKTSSVKIATKYNVTSTTILRIKRGTSWKHLHTQQEIKQRQLDNPMKSGLSVANVRAIKQDLSKGFSIQKCVKIHSVSEQVIKNIKHEKTWKRININMSDDDINAEYFRLKQSHIMKNIEMKFDSNFIEPHWLWTKSLNVTGYPSSIQFYTHYISAYRVSWMVFNNKNEIPGDVIRHKCKFKHCVQPEHLEPGSYKDNAFDMIRDGTAGVGEKNGRSKISESIALLIKESKGCGTQLDRATRFGVNINTVGSIDRGTAWSYLNTN